MSAYLFSASNHHNAADIWMFDGHFLMRQIIFASGCKQLFM